MTIDDQQRDEKIQYDINRKLAKISSLPWGKINKYEYLTGDQLLPFNQKQIKEQAKFTYSPLSKTFQKQIKIIKDQGEKQIKANQYQAQIKTIKNMLIMIRIVHWLQNKKKYLINLQMKGSKK